MEELMNNVNWLAVGVSTVVAFMVCWVWYSPKVFGEKWAAAVGISFDPDMKPPLAPMLAQLTFTFLLAWMVGIAAAHEALLMIILITLMLVFLIASNGLWGKKGHAAIVIEASAVVVMVMLMVVCQALL